MKTCKLDNCETKVHGNGLCTKHYTRMLRHGSTDKPKRSAWNKGITGLPSPRKGAVLTSETKQKIREANIGKTLAEETKAKISKSMAGKNTWMKGKTGDKATRWAGDKVGYSGVHIWIKKVLGKPQECQYCGTTEKKMYHWANISQEYRREVSDWARLCVPCHSNYDRNKIQLERITI